MDRWALFIDIEGFAKIYPADFIRAMVPLRALMESIYYVGGRVCPETPERLFAHQIGDGFMIVSEFAQRSPRLPVAIGVFLLQRVLLAGGIAKCSISQGSFGSVSGCYPDVIRESEDECGCIRLGGGLMTIFPVMGTALINAYRLAGREHGSLLIVDSALDTSLLPAGISVTKQSDEYYIVDWLHAASPELDEIHTRTGIPNSCMAELEVRAAGYILANQEDLPREWKENTQSYNRFQADGYEGC